MKTGFLRTRSFWSGFFITVFSLALTSCQTNQSVDITETPAVSSSVTRAALTPYFTSTATLTPLPPDPATATSFPTPTSTPRSHIVQKGEDMYGIAFQYGITLQELQAANPEVDPNFLSVAMVLLIPASAKTEQTPGTLPSPTPAGALPGETTCYRTGEGGLWCFTIILNQSDKYIEGVSLEVRLGSAGVQVATGSAVTALNLIAPGENIPALVFFPPPIPDPFEVDVVLETSLSVISLAERYYSAGIENLNIKIAPDGKSAAIEGEINLNGAGTPKLVAAAAVAYNSIGDIVGVRRWESGTPGVVQKFSFEVYSLADEIIQVSVFAEAER